MRFSVIIPIYNVEPFLEKCIDSVLRQSYHDYEIILVDDGSTDSCGVIADKKAEKNASISVIHQKNSGLGAARNTGLDVAKGEYIVFVDSDDWIEPDYLATANAIITKKAPDFIHFGWYEDKEGKCQHKCDSCCKSIDRNDFLIRLLKDDVGCQVWKNIYKSSLWHGLRFPMRLYEDLYTTHLVLNKATRLECIEEGFYHYLIRSGNISYTRNPTKGRDIFWGFVSRYDFITENQIELDLYSKMCCNAIQAIHGLSEIYRSCEIKKISEYVLNCHSCMLCHIKEKIELLCARHMTRLYIFGVRSYYKYVRRIQ